ncbi:MAG: T9SS type A sorting domain-containing protein [Cytophagales bacterium]|nr:T9SS type A sorting domain-containing protein [Cytophagales bacterium]
MLKSKFIMIFLICSNLITNGQTINEPEWYNLVWSSAFYKNRLALNKKSIKPQIKNTLLKKGHNFQANQLKVFNPFNFNDSLIKDTADITLSENSVFISPVNPDIILNSNNSRSWPSPNNIGVNGMFSTDGGFSWSGVAANLHNSQADPAVAIGRNGRFYVNYITAPVCNQGISFSDDNGLTWDSVEIATGACLDKNHLWVDNSIMSPNEGNLYCAWTHFGGANSGEIELRYSTDDGLTWLVPASGAFFLSSNFPPPVSLNQGVNIQTGPNGEVYAAWAVYHSVIADTAFLEIAIGFTKSVDGGVTWDTAQVIIDSIQGIRAQPSDKFGFFSQLGGGKTMRTNSFPVMSVNQQNGEIYLVWANRGVPGVNTGDPDIYMIKSSDQGITWNSPIRVNQDSVGNGKDQWFPWIACDDVTGALVVIYYDSRLFINNDSTATFVSVSYNGGSMWEDFLISDVAWSGDKIYSNHYAGDYLGIDISNGKVVPVWSDDRTGNMLAYTQPFEISCDQSNLDLVLCDTNITGAAIFKVPGKITVGDPGCNFVVTNSGNLLMEAGTEIFVTGETEIGGESVLTINPICAALGNLKISNYIPPFAKNETKNELGENDKEQVTDKYINNSSIYPNPFSDITNIEYTLKEGGPVNLSIYNLYGQGVKVLVNEPNQPKGIHRINFNAASLQPGIYYYTLSTKNFSETKKILIIKQP